MSRKGTKGKESSPRARKVAREAKKVTQAGVAVNKPQRNLGISRVSVETAESTDTGQPSNCYKKTRSGTLDMMIMDYFLIGRQHQTSTKTELG